MINIIIQGFLVWFNCFFVVMNYRDGYLLAASVSGAALVTVFGFFLDSIVTHRLSSIQADVEYIADFVENFAPESDGELLELPDPRQMSFNFDESDSKTQ